jgi:predicted small lipoprotein YifL
MRNDGARCAARVNATWYANIRRRITRDKISVRKSNLLLLAMALLPACGLKGPLYIPAQKPAAGPPAAAAPASVPQPEAKTTPAPANK